MQAVLLWEGILLVSSRDVYNLTRSMTVIRKLLVAYFVSNPIRRKKEETGKYDLGNLIPKSRVQS